VIGSNLSVVATDACGWPNLIKLGNGDLLCTYFNAPSHGLIEGDLVCSRLSRTSKKWKKVGTVAKAESGSNRMHLAVGVNHRGDLLCFSSGFIVKENKFVGFAGHWLSRSINNGSNWKVDRNPNIPNKLKQAIPYGRIVRLSSNRLAYACYISQGRGMPSESWLCLSHDDGQTWTKTYKLGKNDSNEVALCSVGKHQLIGVCRTHRDHHLKICRFLESKRKWLEGEALTLPMQHPADLIRLGNNALLMTYGIRNRGLMGIAFRLSIDNGETWLAPCVIHQFGEKARDIGYPSSVHTRQGIIYTAFYTDFEPSIRSIKARYRVLVKRWDIRDWVTPKVKNKIFNKTTARRM